MIDTLLGGAYCMGGASHFMCDAVEFRHLKYIAAIAETANFTRAAEQLFVAQPSLSRQIKELEDRIGFPIFLRNRDGVGITPAGEMIVKYAEEAVKGRNEIFNLALRVYRGEVPVLRVGFSYFVNPNLVQLLRESYTKLFPGCPIQFASGEPSQVLQWMGRGRLEAAILPLPIDGDGLVVEVVASAPLVACLKADDVLAERAEITTMDLAKRLTIFRNPESHPAAHNRLMQLLAEVGIDPEISYLAGTPADIQWMVKSGYGLALIEQATTLDTGLTTRPLVGWSWTTDTALVHRACAEHIALPILVRHLRKVRQGSIRKAPSTVSREPSVQLKLLP